MNTLRYTRLLKYLGSGNGLPVALKLRQRASNSAVSDNQFRVSSAAADLILISPRSAMQKPVVAGWNKPTREYYEVPNTRQSKPLSRTKIHGACVLILAVVFGWQGCVMQGSVLYMTLVMYTLVDHYGVDTRAARRVSQSRGFPKVLATSTVRGRRDLYHSLSRLNRPSSCTYGTLLLRLIPVCTDHRLALVCPSLRCCSRTFAVFDFSSVEEASMVRLTGCERSGV